MELQRPDRAGGKIRATVPRRTRRQLSHLACSNFPPLLSEDSLLASPAVSYHPRCARGTFHGNWPSACLPVLALLERICAPPKMDGRCSGRGPGLPPALRTKSFPTALVFGKRILTRAVGGIVREFLVPRRRFRPVTQQQSDLQCLASLTMAFSSTRCTARSFRSLHPRMSLWDRREYMGIEIEKELGR